MNEPAVKPGRKKGIENFQLDDRGLNQVLLARVALIGSSLATVIVLAGFVCFPASLIPSINKAALNDLESRNHAQLVRTLTRLHGEWDPRLRERMLSSAPQASELVGTLDRFLRLGDSPLLAAAIEFAAATRRVELRPAVVTLLTHSRPAVRYAALIAADRLAPWTARDLEQHVLSDHADLALAALELCKDRADLPMDAIVDRAFDENSKLAAAAQNALPPTLPARLLTPIRERLDASHNDDETLTALTIIAALDPQRLDKATLESVANCARVSNEACRARAIPTLAACRSHPACHDALWALVEDRGMRPATRRRALHGLEGSPPDAIERLEAASLFMDSRDRILVARCMLRCGQHEEAHRTLCAQLAENDNADSIARGEAQRLLGWLTGLGPTASREAFERAVLDNPPRADTALPPPSEALFGS